jgi:hypothetical protein
MVRIKIALFTCLAFSGACSKVKDFEDKTKSMERTTRDMSSTTTQMRGTTTTMYQQIRSKEAEDTRAQKFDQLLDRTKKMGEKFTAAAVYFKSFEYQLWNADVQYDDAESREVLYLDAANEFTRRISDVYEEINLDKMDPTKSGRSHNSEMAFYALAGAMHMNHHFQEELVKNKPNLEAVSFYDLIKKALLRDMQQKRLAEHEIVLMSGMNKEIMIELIKARVDIIAALAVKDLTDMRDMTIGQKAKAALFRLTGGRLGTIDLPETFDRANDATKETIEIRLDAANNARKFLREIGVQKNVERTIKSALSNIDFNENREVADDASDRRKENVRRLIGEILD